MTEPNEHHPLIFLTPASEATNRSNHSLLSSPERIEWPLSRAEGAVIHASLIAIMEAAVQRPEPLAPIALAGLNVEFDALEALTEYACEYWGACDAIGELEPLP